MTVFGMRMDPPLGFQLAVHFLDIHRRDLGNRLIPKMGDDSIVTVRRDIATMEAGLQKLEQQERQYSAELNDALKAYAELQTQAADFDLGELTDARLAIRPDKECEAQRCIQSAYGNNMIR